MSYTSQKKEAWTKYLSYAGQHQSKPPTSTKGEMQEEMSLRYRCGGRVGYRDKGHLLRQLEQVIILKIANCDILRHSRHQGRRALSCNSSLVHGNPSTGRDQACHSRYTSGECPILIQHHTPLLATPSVIWLLEGEVAVL